MDLSFLKVILTTFLVGFGAYASASCPIEKAEYKIKNGNYDAGFRVIGHYNGWVSDLAFYIKSDKSNQIFWFLFDSGSANRITLISTEDVLAKGWNPPDPDGGKRPLGSAQYLSADSKDVFNDIPPRGGQDAPDKILIPDLPILLDRVPGREERAPHAFFDLVGCSM